jgi:tetratricopeptide (TPR) repeat protein
LDRVDRRRIEEAEGFLELELPRRALVSLQAASAAAKATTEWNELAAKAFIGTQQFAEAVPHLFAALQQTRNSVPLLLSLASCYKCTGQYARAIETMKAAERLCRRGSNADSHASVSLGLSGCFALARRKGDMLHWLERALNEDSRLRKELITETDFDAYRRDADFIALLQPTAKPQ